MKLNGLALFAVFSLILQAQVQQDIRAKLLTPLASYSKPGQYFEIRTGAPVSFETGAILPEGTILQGSVREARRVGLGIRRERAQLQLEFQRCKPPGHPAAACAVELFQIDNAREHVAKGNRVHGILAASNPNSLFQGIWFRPAGAFLRRSPAGLTGPVGALQNRIAPSPLGAALTITSRLLLFSLPNAEIELPAGTELILRIKASDAADHPVLPIAAYQLPSVALSEEQAAYLEAVPAEIRNASGNLVGDRMNFCFRATRQQIEAAFAAAGWTTADPLTRRSFARSYAAFTSLRSYAQAPVSPLFYLRGLPDFVLQKSFNTMAKRHHIRFWRVASDSQEPDAPEIWLAAATHDIGIAFDWNRLSLTHRIDEFLDTERSKILSDLSAAHCLRRLTMLNRPALAGKHTDGRLAVVALQPCEPVSAGESFAAIPKPRNPVPVRVARRLILEARQYVTRSNAYYWAYRGARKTVAGIRRGNAVPERAIHAFVPPVPPPHAAPPMNGLR